MHADYETAAQFAQIWGMLFFVSMFVIAAAYALWPKNASKFTKASQIPLNDDADETLVEGSADRGQ